MEDKFKLNTSCKYCEKPMDAKYRSKRFCSPKCRVYFGRENQLKEVLAKGYDKDLLDKIEVADKKESKPKSVAPDPSNKSAYMRWLRENP